jgi:2-polyprenyl-6-methoxyphenol hydroxylase-like FAD-dependent oxidoreductase
LWFRIRRRPDEPDMIELRLSPGRFVALINRRDYWQVAYVIPKGGFEQVRADGLEAFRRSVVTSVPELADRVGELEDWESIKLLTVKADRLQQWYRPGLLCIGDAAHAMSPIAGVGINIAIQDAVEAANLLWQPLSRGELDVRHLARVQRRRELPVRFTQALQGFLQDRIVSPTIGASGNRPRVPKPMLLAMRVPGLRDVPARLIGLGLWRPRVRAPALAGPAIPRRRPPA